MSSPHAQTRSAVSRAIALGTPVAATAALLLGSAIIALPGVAQATTTDAQTIIVTPPSGLLVTTETRSKGHNDFLEDGLHVWTEDTSGLSKAAGYISQSEPLSTLGAAGEPTLDWALDPGMTAIPGKQVVVDFDGTGGPDGILVGEPVYGDNWWLSTSSAPFVQTGAPHTGGGFGSPWYGTLAEWSSAFPSGQVTNVGYSLGSGVHGGGVINSMTYGETTYEFALGVGPCMASINDATQTYTLTQNCSTFHTISVPDGWTIAGNGKTITAVEDASHPNFPGPIVRSAVGTDGAPATLNVQDLTITTNFSGASSGGQLSGIKFDRAGGSVENVTIDGVTHGNGVQEGIALWVRNRTAGGSTSVPEATIAVDDLTVTRYQKSGVIFDGIVDFTMTNSTVGQATDESGDPIGDAIASNSVQLSRGAHGTVSGSTIALNDYTLNDDTISTGVLVYNSGEVTLTQSFVTGDTGDEGMDTYNDGTTDFDTVVNVSCNLFQRNVVDGSDPYSFGIAQYNDGSDPVTLNLSDTTFAGWNADTVMFDADYVAGPGEENQQLGACVPSAPVVSATGGVEELDVTWAPSTAAAYAPISGYDVTLTGNDSSTETQHVGPAVTSAHFDDLGSDVTYTATVVALNASGESDAGTATVLGTELTLAADDPTVTYKKSTFVRGTLTRADTDAGLAGRTVTIEARPNGASVWTVVGTTTTAGDGSYELSVTPKKHTAYRAQYAGGVDMASTSGPATVYVKIKVTLTVSDTTVSEGTTVLFTGKVAPKLKGHEVALEQRVAGVWGEIDSQTLKKGSRFKFFWEATPLGSSDFRITIDGTSNYLKGTSKQVTIVVS